MVYTRFGNVYSYIAVGTRFIQLGSLISEQGNGQSVGVYVLAPLLHVRHAASLSQC